ncbi:MAG: sulfotransferase [Rhodanobacteraceae bacterium]
MQTEQQWLKQTREWMLRGKSAVAESLLANGLTEYPQSIDLRRTLAGVYRQTQRDAQAQSLLCGLLADNPGDTASAFLLAQMLKEQGNMSSAAAVMRTCFEHGQHDAEEAIRAIELLDDCDRKRDAAAIAEAAITTHPGDPRLHAYAGMLESQLGEFERAREHCVLALEQSLQACEWHVPLGLASMQRYPDAEHPDFGRFRNHLQRKDLSEQARSTLLFALGKAHDDIGDYAQAAQYFRQANALAHALTRWSRKHWRRAVEARLAAKPIGSRPDQTPDFVPILIVGMPRSGTTLIAELLARYPRVCNRGESPWLATLAQQPELAGNPKRISMQRAAATYHAQLRQDDADGAQWFIDKQPLNFRYVDLMLALFTNAKIIHCQRNLRDNALSLWVQSFSEEVQGYVYDFADIAIVMNDCERLMTHWRKSHANSICTVHYEKFVARPEAVIAELAEWLELPRLDASAATDISPRGIGTASLWQARQPVYGRSVERWRHYVAYLPELVKFPMDRPSHSSDQRPSGGNSI